MTRRKNKGSRGASPEKQPVPGGQYVGNYSNMEDSGQTWTKVAAKNTNRKGQAQAIDSDRAFQQVQEMFRGQVEPDVVYMMLQESDWRGEKNTGISDLQLFSVFEI